MSLLERSLRTFPAPFLVLGISAACYGLYRLFFKSTRKRINRSMALTRHNSTSLDGASSIEFTRRVFTEEEFVLSKVDRVNGDCKVLRFTKVSRGQLLHIPVAQHVSIAAEIQGELVARPYTPICVIGPRGAFEILVKKYELGKMSSFLHQLEVGKKVRVRHPVGNFRYEPQASPAELILIGAGSGLTPLLRIIREVIENGSGDATVLRLLYQNRRVGDILAREELEELSRGHPNRLHLSFALTMPPANWNTSGPHCVAGHFDETQLKNLLPAPTESTRILICGPAGFNASMDEMLKNLGYDWFMIRKL